MTLSEKALEIAISQIGTQEDAGHTNKGDSVKYQQSVGLGSKGGFPWCQSFVYWCYQKAADELQVENPVIKTGGVLDCWNRTDKSKRVTKDSVIKGQTPVLPGSQFIFKEGAMTGHTGIVEKIEGTEMHTIEGNTNEAGGRDGYEVCRKVRQINTLILLGFIKY